MGFTQIDQKCYIIVFCRQGDEFAESFKKSMEKAELYKKYKKKLLKRQEMMSDGNEYKIKMKDLLNNLNIL